MVSFRFPSKIAIIWLGNTMGKLEGNQWLSTSVNTSNFGLQMITAPNSCALKMHGFRGNSSKIAQVAVWGELRPWRDGRQNDLPYLIGSAGRHRDSRGPNVR
jgi:hypothetical protein